MSPQMKSLQDVRALAGGELSMKARLGYVALLCVSISMTAVVVSLWLTEVSLRLRTGLAFGVMCIIGASWIGLSMWALRARRPLFARDRVIAGRMAVTFTSVFMAGAIAAVWMSGNAASYAALTTGAVLLALAITALVSARRRFAQLASRLAALDA